MSIAVNEHPEVGPSLSPTARVAPHKIDAPSPTPDICTPLGVLDARLQVLDFLIEKELDDLSQLDRYRSRIKDRLHRLGQERTATKEVAKAFNDEADPADERTTA